MLTHLHIRNFAIIDSSELELSNGMTALTGETGAGKSILLDALGLVTGARASADSVQQGASRSDITAVFSLDALPGVVQWLTEHELNSADEDDTECLVRRTVSSNGKSRATINDVPVSVQLLKTLGEQLLNIHGQHAHQTLGKASEQRELLDSFAGGSVYSAVEKAFNQWQEADQALKDQARNANERSQRIDLLSFQLQEFDELDIGSATVEDLSLIHI